MLDLESERWHELRHAYGMASDTPALLRQLPTARVKSDRHDREPWFSLWSALCHQSDVYPASFASAPHIVTAAAGRRPADRAEYLCLAGTIESMRHKASSPTPPVDIAPAYSEAMRVAVPLALDALREESDPTWFQGVLAALAAFLGHPELGAAISELRPEIDCPECGESFVAPGYDEFDQGRARAT